MADILVGINSGISAIKAVAFDLAGRQLAAFAVPNTCTSHADGVVTQSLTKTWDDCVRALRALAETLPGLANRTSAISVTAQGDGTGLAGKGNAPVGEGWLWLDARAAPTVERLAAGPMNRARFAATGTGLNTCQQGSQMAHMDRFAPELLDAAEVALHCKDWLYLNLTGVRATDPSEASFTFGNFRNCHYDPTVIEALGLTHRRALLPEIIDGSQITHPLTKAAADATGLLPGTPVSLAFVDMAMTAFGAGVYTGQPAACSIVGSTGGHLRSTDAAGVHLNDEGTGYVIALPIPGSVTQVQTNMAAALIIDWVLRMAADLGSDLGKPTQHADLVPLIEGWLAATRQEAGAAAMMSAVAIGVYPTMQACVAEWVTPLLAEAPDQALAETCQRLYARSKQAREALTPVWAGLAGIGEYKGAK